jgi:hypothetical protein
VTVTKVGGRETLIPNEEAQFGFLEEQGLPDEEEEESEIGPN